VNSIFIECMVGCLWHRNVI